MKQPMAQNEIVRELLVVDCLNGVACMVTNWAFAVVVAW